MRAYQRLMGSADAEVQRFPQLIRDVVSYLRVAVLNAFYTLIPVALANRLVSLSDVLSSRILETFAREIVQQSSGRAECLL